MRQTPKIKNKLTQLPRNPGVYFHKSKTGEVIYVGKASVLRNRVRQYFQNLDAKDAKTRALVSEIDDIDWIETDSELDALFLESEMIKRYMPKYNVLLRDDKSQTFVRIDTKSQWPTVSFTRNPLDDGAEYFGPYYNSYAIKKALRYLRKIFPYYIKQPKDTGRQDLDVHLGLSPSPNMSRHEYMLDLRQLIKYIKGGRKDIVRNLEKNMQQAADRQEFEKASVYRNRLYNIKALQQRIMFGDREHLDISKDKALAELKNLFGLNELPARIECYDVSHISGSDVVASMVVFSNGASDRSRYRKFKLKQQKNDDYASMYEVIYRRFSDKNLRDWGKPNLILVDGGAGQLTSAIKAMSDRGVSLPIVGVAKREEEIIINSDKSQVNFSEPNSEPSGVVVSRSGEFLNVNLHPGRQNASGHSRNLRGSIDGAMPSKFEDVILLIQRIRDEAHRFAINYHSNLHRQRQTSSVLERIDGVGPATRKKLTRAFGSLAGIKHATREQLADQVGVKKSEIIYNSLHDQ